VTQAEDTKFCICGNSEFSVSVLQERIVNEVTSVHCFLKIRIYISISVAYLLDIYSVIWVLCSVFCDDFCSVLTEACKGMGSKQHTAVACEVERRRQTRRSARDRGI